MYNIIGDIHGQFNKLDNLNKKLVNHQTIFLGDYIDRGPYQKQTVDFVKQAVDNGHIAIMGNHEFNAICYSSLVNGSYLRPRNQKNTKQHQAYINEYPLGSDDHQDSLEFFKSLPLYYENPYIRCVHACWNDDNISIIKEYTTNGVVNDWNIFLTEYSKKERLYHAVEQTLKGIEYDLPDGIVWYDKDGIERTKVRYNWFSKVDTITYKNSSLSIDPEIVPDIKIINPVKKYNHYKPVFFGHYWMSGVPSIQNNKVCCLDYSAGKGGTLVAYHYTGENNLSNNNFIY